MGWMTRVLDRLAPDVAPTSARSHLVGVEALMLGDMTDPAMHAFMRGGSPADAAVVNARTVLRNAGVFRCVSLISNAIGMLPFHLIKEVENGQVEKARAHALYEILAIKPNNWQTGFVFRRLMQHRVLVHGNAYALVIRSRGQVKELIPIDPHHVTPKIDEKWQMTYEVRRKGGGATTFPASDILHLMGPSEDGIRGLALTDYAGEVLGLSLAAQRSAAQTFRNGVSAGGVLAVDGALSEEALARLRSGMEQYQGPENAGKWIVGEHGLKATPFGGSGRENQNVEQRQHQIEEVARIFGVPRPFLMVDDTSWGSGIEQLGIFFVQYGLAPHFVCWEQAVARTLLNDDERQSHYAKFNERALLRGSMKDQADFFAKALGTGGGRAWMTQDEVRGLQELGRRGGDAGELSMGLTSAETRTRQ